MGRTSRKTWHNSRDQEGQSPPWGRLAFLVVQVMVIIVQMQSRWATNQRWIAWFWRTGLMLTSIGGLKSRHEGVDVNDCQLRVTIHKHGIRIVVHVDRIGWSPCWCRRFPQSAMSQYFLNHFALRWFDERNYFHFATAVRTDHGINLVHPLEQHRPGMATANSTHV